MRMRIFERRARRLAKMRVRIFERRARRPAKMRVRIFGEAILIKDLNISS